MCGFENRSSEPLVGFLNGNIPTRNQANASLCDVCEGLPVCFPEIPAFLGSAMDDWKSKADMDKAWSVLALWKVIEH